MVLLPLFLVTWIVLGLISNSWVIIAVRFLTGAISGVFIDCCTSYIVEISHVNLRGKLVALMDTARQFGYLYVYSVGGTGLSWRETAFVCGASTTIIPFIALFLIPSSPRWLSTRGRFDDAKKSLKFFRGDKYKCESELNDIKAQLKENIGTDTILGQAKLLCQRKIGLRLLLVSTLMLVLNFNGNAILITYAVVIFKSANTGLNEYTVTIIFGAVRVAGALSFLLVAERFPRKIIFIVNMFISVICITIIGVYFYLDSFSIDMSSVQWIITPLLGITSFVNGQMQPVISMLRSELLPNSVRALAVGVCVIILCVGGFVSIMTFPMISSIFGIYTSFWFYGFCGIIAMVIVVIFVPETKGKSLEEINAEVVLAKK